MGNMRFKVGDRVQIKSLGWYNENKDESGYINCGSRAFFTKMSDWCGKILTINRVVEEFKYYCVSECIFSWTDEMIEGLVEEEIKSEPKFHIGDWATDGDVLAEDSCIFIIQKLGDNGTAAKTYCALHNDGYFIDGSILYFDIDSIKPATEEEKQKLFKAIKDNGYKWNSETKTLEKLIEPLDVPTMTTEFVKEHGLPCPEGYQFVDENGNVINATKIVLEKKKKEYPKTYEECLPVLEIYNRFPDVEVYNAKPSECKLFESFIRLKRCRDAYWKIAGEEMGLGKPWEPSKDKIAYSIYRYSNEIETDFSLGESVTFEFPTEEMRDAFKENFDPDIEICKELL